MPLGGESLSLCSLLSERCSWLRPSLKQLNGGDPHPMPDQEAPMSILLVCYSPSCGNTGRIVERWIDSLK